MTVDFVAVLGKACRPHVHRKAIAPRETDTTVFGNEHCSLVQ